MQFNFKVVHLALFSNGPIRMLGLESSDRIGPIELPCILLEIRHRGNDVEMTSDDDVKKTYWSVVASGVAVADMYRII